VALRGVAWRCVAALTPTTRCCCGWPWSTSSSWSGPSPPWTPAPSRRWPGSGLDGWRPTGYHAAQLVPVHGVGGGLGPAPGQREGQRHVQQLGLGVGPCGVPAAAGPLRIVEVGVAAVVHARAEEHQPRWPVDQGGEQVGGEHVDGEHVGEPVGRLDALGLKVGAGVVDHRFVAAGGVGLRGDLAGLLDAGEVADQHATGAGRGGAGGARPGGVAGVQYDLVAAAMSWRPASRPSPWAEPVISTRDIGALRWVG
jgi:hypothetical protein